MGAPAARRKQATPRLATPGNINTIPCMRSSMNSYVVSVFSLPTDGSAGRFGDGTGLDRYCQGVRPGSLLPIGWPGRLANIDPASPRWRVASGHRAHAVIRNNHSGTLCASNFDSTQHEEHQRMAASVCICMYSCARICILRALRSHSLSTVVPGGAHTYPNADALGDGRLPSSAKSAGFCFPRLMFCMTPAIAQALPSSPRPAHVRRSSPDKGGPLNARQTMGIQLNSAERISGVYTGRRSLPSISNTCHERTS